MESSKTKWPDGFFDFLPIEDVPDFKALREDLKENIFKEKNLEKAKKSLENFSHST